MTTSSSVPVLLLLSAFAVGPGCAVAEECDAVCDAARPAYEACMDQWGLAYGDGVGLYESPQDYDNWCATYNRERRLLAATANDPSKAEEELDDRCGEQTAVLDAGDCGLYYSVFTEPDSD